MYYGVEIIRLKKGGTNVTLNSRYYLRGNQRNHSGIILYLALAILIVLPTTIARYTSYGNSSMSAQVAKWNIVINGETITGNKTTLDNPFSMVLDSYTGSKITSGDTGSFDIIINPSTTEVSVNYQIAFSISGDNDFDSKIRFYQYILNDDNSDVHSITNNILTDNIYLDLGALTNADIRKYKVCWIWTGSDFDIGVQELVLKAQISVSQIINN